MQRRTLLAGAAVALAGCSSEAAETGPDVAAAEQQALERANRVREAAGSDTLSWRASLADTARAHSRDMAAREFFAHKNPDGEQPWDRAACRAAENITRGEVGTMQTDDGERWTTATTDGLAGAVVRAWELSPPHYEILIKNEWSAAGIGLHVADGEYWATGMFC